MAGRFTIRIVAAAMVIFVVMVAPQPAPATITEQRRRLPPPAHCDDPVEGIWRSHQYSPRFRDWYIFTLEIRRDGEQSNRLTGSIQAHSWNGSEQDEEPPPCRGRYPSHWTVMMTAQGRVMEDSMRIDFGGTSWENENSYCGRQPRNYNLDQFSGTIDPEIEEFQSVNNDGGRARNVPTVFRRIRCFDNSVPAPSVTQRTPTFRPERQSEGCSFL